MAEINQFSVGIHDDSRFDSSGPQFCVSFFGALGMGSGKRWPHSFAMIQVMILEMIDIYEFLLHVALP